MTAMRALAAVVSALLAAQAGAPAYDIVIRGARVLDPASALDAVRSIGITGKKIAVVSADAIRGRTEIDATGLVAAPGFIDLHSHGQTPENYRYKAMDGVTAALELEVGVSPVSEWYKAREGKSLIHFGASAGHIPARMAVMKDSGGLLPRDAAMNRAATPEEQSAIEAIVRRDLDEGGVGMGMGITYTPTATRDEILSLFRLAAGFKRPVFVHMRGGDVVASLQEVIADSAVSGAPLHVVHINSVGLAETPELLRMISDARAHGRDVTTEAYPYDAGMTEIQSATIQDVYKTAPDERLAEIEWPPTGERLNRESFERYTRTGGPVVIHTNTEEMVAAAIGSPLTIIASDAYWQDGRGHPRTTGTFARVLGRYVREARADVGAQHAAPLRHDTLSLMDALRKMTLMPAQRLGARVPAMRQKGRLRVGADADITIFDPATVIDRSTYREPSLAPVGIQYVIVNGVPVVVNGRAVEGVTPGKAVRSRPLPKRKEERGTVPR